MIDSARGSTSARRLRLAAWILVSLTLSWGPLTFARGADGHAIVATLLQSRLHQPARLEAQRLLATEPGATLVSVASWADEVRSPTTSRWHYESSFFSTTAGAQRLETMAGITENSGTAGVMSVCLRSTSVLSSAVRRSNVTPSGFLSGA